MLTIGVIVGTIAILLFASILYDLLFDDLKNNRPYIVIGPIDTNKIEVNLRSILVILGRLHTSKQIAGMQDKLDKIGRPYKLTGQEYLGLRVLTCISMGLIPAMFIRSETLLIFAGFTVGWFYPYVAMEGYQRNKRTLIRRDFPYAVDVLSICINAGLGFDMALRKIIPVLPAGAFKDEFQMVVKEIDMGKARKDALREMASRIRLPELSSFISNLCQAEELGTSIASSLPGMAEQIRTKAFLSAETSAAKVPVIMLFPLVCFIFPCILILLMAPLYLSGALNL